MDLCSDGAAYPPGEFLGTRRMVPGGVPRLAGGENLGRVLGDVHAQRRVLVVEREADEDLGAEEPEVVLRQLQFLRADTTQIADILARVDTAGALARRNSWPWVGGSSTSRTRSNRLPTAV